MTKAAPLLDTNILIDVLNGHEPAGDYLKKIKHMKALSTLVTERSLISIPAEIHKRIRLEAEMLLKSISLKVPF